MNPALLCPTQQVSVLAKLPSSLPSAGQVSSEALSVQVWSADQQASHPRPLGWQVDSTAGPAGESSESPFNWIPG